MRITSVGLILCLWCTTTLANTHYFSEVDTAKAVENFAYGDLIHVRILVAADVTEETTNEPESGDLIIPGEEEVQNGEKKCLTVCKKWGEDCVINPRTGQRQCRKTCKAFGEECF